MTKRIVTLAILLSLLFCVLIVRFFHIQVWEGERWTQIAMQQHHAVVVEPCMRGTVYSNTSIKAGHPEAAQPLVLDVPKFHLFADPMAIPEAHKEELARQLAHGLRLDEGEVLAALRRKSRSRKVATWLDREGRNRVETWWRSFARTHHLVRNALYFQPDFQRSYPFGSMLGAVLHTVQQERDPKTQAALATGGLELVCDSYLRGKPGKRRLLRSPRHPLDAGVVLEASEHGADVYLTVNHYLQAIAEAELARGVAAARAKGGWAVLMEVGTGEIWALAQVPSFDPTRYALYFNDPVLVERAQIQALHYSFEPGSIFKPITMAVCLRANEELRAQERLPLFSPEEKVATSNGQFPGRSFPLKDGRHHAFLNMNLALQKSSNIYVGRLVHRLVETLGNDWYRQALCDFGFGIKTGVEVPAEHPGMMPTPGKLHPNGTLEWSKPTPYSLAIGHNILVNSMQIAAAYAMIASEGCAVRPHLIRKIVKGESVLVDNTAVRPGPQLLSRDSARALIRAMKFATKIGGTSTRADVSGYTEAGKSGTSEKIVDGAYSKERYLASFAGIVPAEAPRFVLIVTLDEPERTAQLNHHGGVSAAPIFREIATRTLQYLGVAPDDPYGYPDGDPRRDPKRADWVCEVEQLRQLYEAWNAS